jgi:serine/threonine protein kinase
MSEANMSVEVPHATRALRVGNGSSPVIPAHTSEAAVLPTVCSADLTRDDLTGLSLGQYELGVRIGGGGMGTVFSARHRHLDRLFAIKFVSAAISSQADAQLRFEQETRALGQLQHPQIVNAVDAGCVNGIKFLVTEFIDGEDLARLVMRRGALAPAEACELIRQAALGLACLHAAGFVHRDIKPSNLIVNRDGVVKILDFGLVQGGEVDHQLTDAGQAMGTWDFLAPEQAQDASQVDHLCDIYSLGCTLLYLLSGRAPFDDDRYTTPAAKLKGHLFDIPSALAQPPADIPKNLLELLGQMLAKSPSRRIRSADEVATKLSPFVQLEADQEFPARDGSIDRNSIPAGSHVVGTVVDSSASRQNISPSANSNAMRTRKRLLWAAGTGLVCAMGWQFAPRLAGVIPVSLTVTPMIVQGRATSQGQDFVNPADQSIRIVSDSAKFTLPTIIPVRIAADPQHATSDAPVILPLSEHPRGQWEP